MFKLLCLFGLIGIISGEMVPVEVYYESLCPDSIAFIRDQLYPAYQTHLKDHMELKLIPYGKASRVQSNDAWTITCHHGPVECYGNKVHACIIRNIMNKSKQLEYINCLMKQADTNKRDYPLNKCIENSPDVSSVSTCANSTIISQGLVIENAEATERLTPHLSSVPTVVFNKKYNPSESAEALKDFKKVFCSHLKDSKCDSHSGASYVSFVPTFFLLPFAISRYF